MNLDASQAKTAFQFKNIKLKLLNTIQNIKFNKTCLNLKLTPKYIQVKINNNSYAARKTKLIAENIWIKQEIKFLYQKKSILNTLLYKKHLALLGSLHPAQCSNLFYKLQLQIDKVMSHKKRIQARKLEQLISTRDKPRDSKRINHTFYPRVVNLSNITFTDEEMNLLNKGLKHNLQPINRKKHLISEILNAETALCTLTDDNLKTYIRHKISRKINAIPFKKTKPYLDIKIAEQIKQKLVDNKCIVSKADKGQTLIVIPVVDYNQKVLDFIESNNISEIGHDPTEKFNRTIKNLINNNCTNLFDKSEIKYLKMMDPSTPSLTGLPKLHKDNLPIRPLVNFTTAPSYRLAKKLDKIIRAHTVFDHNHSVKNSIELVNFTKHLNIENHHTMASFDIVNLYTNVPIEETLKITKERLDTSKTLSAQAINELICILREVLKQNYFTFDNRYYIQNEGLAMGSPLSGILSEIYLNHIENKHILSESNKFSKNILFYKRYVDDTFLIYNGNQRQLNLLKNQLNKISNTLQFTLEVEKDSKLNFLDLTFTKHEQKIAYNIYRKPTYTDHTIHQTSYHPMNHKLAAYNSMIHRLITIPLSSEEYNNELTIIKHIAVTNGYETTFIDKLLNRMISKSKIMTTTNLIPAHKPKIISKYISIEYGDKLNNILRGELRTQNITLSNRTSNKLQKILTPNKHNNKRNTGIYKLTCSDCPKFYIGQTGRSFNKRFEEHIPKINLQNQRSKFAEHLINDNHSIENYSTNLEILYKCSKGPMMNTLESYEIYKAFKNKPNDTLNEKLKFTSNILFDLSETIIKRKPDAEDTGVG